jgi:hypothetical protein
MSRVQRAALGRPRQVIYRKRLDITGRAASQALLSHIETGMKRSADVQNTTNNRTSHSRVFGGDTHVEVKLVSISSPPPR